MSFKSEYKGKSPCLSFYRRISIHMVERINYVINSSHNDDEEPTEVTKVNSFIRKRFTLNCCQQHTLKTWKDLMSFGRIS